MKVFVSLFKEVRIKDLTTSCKLSLWGDLAHAETGQYVKVSNVRAKTFKEEILLTSTRSSSMEVCFCSSINDNNETAVQQQSFEFTISGYRSRWELLIGASVAQTFCHYTTQPLPWLVFIHHKPFCCLNQIIQSDDLAIALNSSGYYRNYSVLAVGWPGNSLKL